MKANNNKINFTIREIDKLEPAKKGSRYTIYDAGCPCLCLRVTDKGIKSFSVYKKSNGKVIRVTLGKYPSMKIEQARKLTIDNLQQINEKINPNEVKKKARAEMTLGTIYDLYMEQHAKLHCKPLTIKKNKRIWELHLIHLKNRMLSNITKDEIIKLQISVKEKHGLFAGNSVVRFTRLLYNQALSRDWIGNNITIGIKFFQEKSRERYLLPEEVKRLYKILNEETNNIIKDFIYVALYTGVRKSNIFSMKWDDIDFSSKTWYIEETKNGESQTVVLIDDLIDVLEKRKITALSKWVFPSENSRSGHIEDVTKNWKNLLEKAEIDNFRIHDLRRTFGSYQAISGVNSFTIGKALNHKSLDSTKIYARMNLDSVRVAINQAVDVMKSFKE